MDYDSGILCGVLTGLLLFYLIPKWRYYSLLLVATTLEATMAKSDLSKWLLVLFQFYMVL
jgi:hypothetical protein